MLRSLAVAVMLSLSAACAPQVAPTASEPLAAAPAASPAQACAQKGGTLRPVGRMQTIQCVIAYADAGKRCTSGEQCQGQCRLEQDRPPPEGAAVAGVCQATSDQFGCYTTIENGRAGPAICVD